MDQMTICDVNGITKPTSSTLLNLSTSFSSSPFGSISPVITPSCRDQISEVQSMASNTEAYHEHVEMQQLVLWPGAQRKAAEYMWDQSEWRWLCMFV